MSLIHHRPRSLSGATATIGAATAVSRMLGLVRDAVIAAVFGAGWGADAFFIAFRIPNLLRRLFADGALTSAFIPAFVRLDRRNGRTAAFDMGRSAMGLAVLGAVGAVGVGILAAPLVVRILAPGYDPSGDLFALTVLLTRVMFPYVIWISLVSVAAGMLNGLGHFSSPALAPAVLNLSIIGAAFGVTIWMRPPVLALAIGVVFGGAGQWALQWWGLGRFDFPLAGTVSFRRPVLWQIARQTLPAAIGGAIFQINLLVTTVLATWLPAGRVSCLYFAERLVQLPLGLFAASAATALLPELARRFDAGQTAEYREMVMRAMTRVLFLTVPAMVGLMLLRGPIVDVLFGRGRFDPLAVQLTASAVLYYALGLWAVAAARVWTAACHAAQDFRSPIICGIIAVAVNFVLGMVLMPVMGHAGLALAIAIAAMIQTGCLAVGFRRTHGPLGGRRLVNRIAVVGLLTAAMAIAVWAATMILPGATGRSWAARAIRLAGCIGIGAGVYLSLAGIVGCEEITPVVNVWRRVMAAFHRDRAGQ